MIDIILQVNGKKCNTISIIPNIGIEGMREAALNDNVVKQVINGKPPKKIVIVENHLVNIVV